MDSVTKVTDLLHYDETALLKQLKGEIASQMQMLWGMYQDSLELPVVRKAAVEAVQEFFHFGLEGKFCTKCKTTKVRGEFGADNSKPDGLFYWCRACRCKSNEERQGGVNTRLQKPIVW